MYGYCVTNEEDELIYSPVGSFFASHILWHARFAHTQGDTLKMKTGLDYTAFKLHPGERIRTSSILLMEYEGSRVQGRKGPMGLSLLRICEQRKRVSLRKLANI